MKKTVIFIFLTFLISCKNKNEAIFGKLEGHALGTSFHITYDKYAGDIKTKDIDSLFYRINKSMSTYISSSDISKINRSDTTVIVDEMFQEVFKKSKRIFNETNHSFDPTIGILVNAWGFGPDKKTKNLDSIIIKRKMAYVGLDKVKIINNKVIKELDSVYLDFNAIAKGYAVDIIGRFLEENNINNYLVEIGGEIRARGINSNQIFWKIAIEKPNFNGSRSFQTIIELNNESIATSGNYRKFKIDSITGKKYAHTIDTKTGFPSNSNLLSASVIANLDCADVDAYATALMAMGLKKSKIFLSDHQDLKAYLIYSDENGKLNTFKTENLRIQKSD